MHRNSKRVLVWSIAGLMVLAAVLYVSLKPKTPGQYDALAKCITDSGAKFYGAFWCPHCQSQKALFGKSAKLLPYVECSTADGKGQLQVCTDKNISGYPTWEFADGSRLSGEVALQTLSDKTGCALP